MQTGMRADVLQATIETLQLLREKPAAAEAIVRQSIILRYLQAVGFNIWDSMEVTPEEVSAAGYRPDFLINGRKEKFALEIKGAGISFSTKEYQQVINYAAGQGIRWAILTNGRSWVVIDERAHGKPEEREVFRLELTPDNHEEFADDLASILDKEVWDEGMFAAVNIDIGQRIKNRFNKEKIISDKLHIVKQFQAKYNITDYNKSVELCQRLGDITMQEAAVLLGNDEAIEEEVIHFTCKILGAIARAVYRPSDGTWTVIAGSTALNRKMVIHDKGIERRRRKHLGEGVLKVLNDELYIYLDNVVYHSCSSAAQDIVGGARNGWETWVDSEGNKAKIHMPPAEQAPNRRGRKKGSKNKSKSVDETKSLD